MLFFQRAHAQLFGSHLKDHFCSDGPPKSDKCHVRKTSNNLDCMGLII